MGALGTKEAGGVLVPKGRSGASCTSPPPSGRWRATGPRPRRRSDPLLTLLPLASLWFFLWASLLVKARSTSFRSHPPPPFQGSCPGAPFVFPELASLEVGLCFVLAEWAYSRSFFPPVNLPPRPRFNCSQVVINASGDTSLNPIISQIQAIHVCGYRGAGI